MSSIEKYTAAEIVNAVHNACGSVEHAAEILDCSPSTVYRYAKRYSTVEQAINDARINVYAEAEGALHAMVRNAEHRKHFQAVMKVLRTYSRFVDDGVNYQDDETGQAITATSVTVNYPNSVPEPDGWK